MTQSISRRQAIRMMALGGIAFGFGLEELRHLATTSTYLTKVHETRLLMGTVATLTILSNQSDTARIAIDSAFAQMERLEQVLSRFQKSSQVSQLNRMGSLTGISPDLYQILTKSINYAERTFGAFDITVEPVLEMYRRAARQGELPEKTQLDQLRQLVDYHQVRLTPDSVTLGKQGMAITLDGIAKGYILSAGADVLAQHGFADVLVEAGGDLMARGMVGNGGWRIGIRDPQMESATELLGTMKVENAALATSGDYRNQFMGTSFHHIIDPTTSISPCELSSVTVLTSNTCDADALSTALMVLDSQAGLAFAEQIPQTQVMMVDKQGVIMGSTGFPDLLDVDVRV